MRTNWPSHAEASAAGDIRPYQFWGLGVEKGESGREVRLHDTVQTGGWIKSVCWDAPEPCLFGGLTVMGLPVPMAAKKGYVQPRREGGMKLLCAQPFFMAQGMEVALTVKFKREGSLKEPLVVSAGVVFAHWIPGAGEALARQNLRELRRQQGVHATLNTARLYEALDTARADADLSWRQLAQATHLSASTFTRLKDGASPSADALLAMLAWLDWPDTRTFAIVGHAGE